MTYLLSKSIILATCAALTPYDRLALPACLPFIIKWNAPICYFRCTRSSRNKFIFKTKRGHTKISSLIEHQKEINYGNMNAPFMQLFYNTSYTSLNSLSRLFDLVPWSHDSTLTLAFQQEQEMAFVKFLCAKIVFNEFTLVIS